MAVIDFSKLSPEELKKMLEEQMAAQAAMRVDPTVTGSTSDAPARRALLSQAEPAPEEPKKRSFLSQILPDTDEGRAALRRSLLLGGAQMMMAGGPSYTPTNLMQVMGQGLAAGTAGYDGYLDGLSEREKGNAAIAGAKFKMQSELRIDGLRKRASDIISAAAKNGDAGLAADQLFELAALQTEMGDEAGARDSLDKGQKLQQTMAGKGFQRNAETGAYQPVDGLETSTTRVSAAEDAGKKPTAVKEYEYGLTNPDFRKQQLEDKKAGATNVTVEGNKVGSIPAGYQLVEDKVAGITRMEPIPGSPAAQEAADRQKKVDKTSEIKTTYSDAVTNAVDDIFRLDRDASLPTTGMGGSLLSGVPGTSAHDIGESLKTIKANAAFERLQAMRDASQTGGALGGVSEKEMALLESSYAALEQSQTEEQFKRNLIRFNNTYIDVVHGNGKRPDLYKREEDFIKSKGASDSPISVNTISDIEKLPSGSKFTYKGQTHTKK